MRNAVLILSILALFSCGPRAPVSNENIDLAVEQSHRVIKAGEIVTFTAHASGVAGREEKIKWESDSINLDTVNNSERYARATFEKPGIYSVTSKLYVDGKLLDSEKVFVEVQALK